MLEDGFVVSYSEFVGEFIDSGCFKNIYAVKSNPEYVVALLHEASEGSEFLKREQKELQKVESFGLPAAKWVSFGRVYMDRNTKYRAAIMRRYASGFRAYGEKHQRVLLDCLGEKTIQDAERMKEAILSKQLAIGDFQFLYDKDGSIAVNDPNSVLVVKSKDAFIRGYWTDNMEFVLDGAIASAEYVIAVREGRAVHRYDTGRVLEHALQWKKKQSKKSA